MMFRILTILLLVLCTSGCNQGPRYEQIFTGFNGPSSTVTKYFMDQHSVKSSWLSRALTPPELERVLSQVSFERQMLVVVAVGMRENVTGKVTLESINQYKSSLMTYIEIGVNDTGCIQADTASYPFVLAVVERLQQFDGMENYFHQNFPDGCKPAKSGTPSE